MPKAPSPSGRRGLLAFRVVSTDGRHPAFGLCLGDGALGDGLGRCLPRLLLGSRRRVLLGRLRGSIGRLTRLLGVRRIELLQLVSWRVQRLTVIAGTGLPAV